MDLAAPIALGATIAHLRGHPGAYDDVRFVLFDSATFEAFTTALGDLATDVA